MATGRRASLRLGSECKESSRDRPTWTCGEPDAWQRARPVRRCGSGRRIAREDDTAPRPDPYYESLRRYGAKEGILAAWAITTEGRKVLLHLAVGNKESEACWTEFVRNMVSRGLRTPLSVTSDGAPGLLNAIAQVFPRSLRIRCWYHRMGNIRAKLSADDAPEVLAHVRAIRDAATYDAGCALAAQVIETFAERFPSAMACLADDLEASLAHLKLPVRHRVNTRTTNLLERSFEEERRRTKVIPRLLDERSAMKLVFATLMRCSDRWNRVSVSDLERQQLRLLRRQLGIDPEPEPTTKPRHGRRQKQRGGQAREAGKPYRSKLMEFLDGNSDVLERWPTDGWPEGRGKEKSRFSKRSFLRTNEI